MATPATTILYIAVSLDGYIARPDGSIDWLTAMESEGENYGYGEFYEALDGLVMGRKTFEQVLSFGKWPYPGKPTVVLTRQAMGGDRPDITFAEGVEQALQHLEQQGRSRIWLIGGGEVVRAFLQHRRIDEWILFIMPVLLGEGLSLFPGSFPETHLERLSTTAYKSGAVQLHYRTRR